jgi:APA family basic amino acid/polyamine antiporter
MTFAELGGVYARTGGQYEILRDAYGSFTAFLFVFCNATAVQAGSIAIIAYYSAVNLVVACGGSFDQKELCVGVGSAMIIALAGTNWLGVKWGSLAQNVTVVMKIATLIVITIVALMFQPAALLDGGEMVTETTGQVGSSETAAETGITFTVFLAALVPALFAFGGWQHALWVGGEVKNPQRNVPWAILGGVVIVTLVYLFVNWAFFRLLGFSGVAGSRTVAADAVGAVWPVWGGRVVAGAVAVSGFGVLNSQLLSGPRLICGMARDGRFFRPFAKLSPRFATPHLAILLLAGMGLGLLLVAGADNTDQIMNGVVMIDAVFFILTGLALIVLRRKFPSAPWSYRSPWFPSMPILFGLGELLVLVGAFSMEKYQQSSYLSALWILAAALCYVAFFRKRIAPSL